MADGAVSRVVQQLGYLGPSLVVYLVGLVLAIVFYRRAPLASLLTIVGALLLIVAGLAAIGAQEYLFELRTKENWTTERFMQASSFVAKVNSLGRAIGSGLIVAAVFANRPRADD